MTIYVDPPTYYPNTNLRYKTWSHMASDNYDDLTELHTMAERLGLKLAWFQNHPTHPHYDITPTKRQLAIAYGAIPVDAITLVKKCSKVFRALESQK